MWRIVSFFLDFIKKVPQIANIHYIAVKNIVVVMFN